MYGSHLRQCSNTLLEVFLLSCGDICEIGSERHRGKGAHEDIARRHTGSGHHIVGALTEISEESAFEQQTYHGIAFAVREFELFGYLHTVGLNANAQEFTAFTALHRGNRSADWRNDLHLLRCFVHKQRGTD